MQVRILSGAPLFVDEQVLAGTLVTSTGSDNTAATVDASLFAIALGVV